MKKGTLLIFGIIVGLFVSIQQFGEPQTQSKRERLRPKPAAQKVLPIKKMRNRIFL